jgi:hypothetical protein
MTQQAQPFISRPTRLGGSIADCVVCDAPLSSYEVRGRGIDRLGFIVDRSQCYCYGCISLAPKTTAELIDSCAYAREQMQGDAQRHNWKGGRIGSCALLMAEVDRLLAEGDDDEWM